MRNFGYLTAIMQVFLMISVWGHYTIDMLSGLVFAHYFYIIATKYSDILDFKICWKTKKPNEGLANQDEL